MKSKSLIAGQSSWTIENGSISLAVTERGGMMAPVTFFTDTDAPVSPYYISPWAEESLALEGIPGVLIPLRGDFFCLPFGADNTHGGETHPPHGEVSEENWTLLTENPVDRIEMELVTKARRGRVVKSIELKKGENNLYVSHLIENFAGPTSYGYHPIFSGGTRKYISTSPILFGLTDERSPHAYKDKEYVSLASGERFASLERVPTIWKAQPFTDCSIFPAREGFVDHLQVFNKQDSAFAWSAVSCPEEGWVWFALKDPKILPSSLLWMENFGRHHSPWKGRNSCIGIEDVCSYLAHGLRASVEENLAGKAGARTFRNLKEDEAFRVPLIQGVGRIPRNFTKVEDIIPKGQGIEISFREGRNIEVKVDLNFLKDSLT